MSAIILNKKELGIAEDGYINFPELPGVIDFDVDMLPASLKKFAIDLHERMQCPLDFVGVCLMASLSAVVGHKKMIYGKRLDNWYVVPNLWCALIGDPSTMKSPAIAAVVSVLTKIDNEYYNNYEEDLKQYSNNLEFKNLVLDEQRKKIKSALKNNDTSLAKEHFSSSDDVVSSKPERQYFIEMDSTTESLQTHMSTAVNGLLLLRDELGGFIGALEREDRQEARSFYLLSASGKESFSQSRVSRGDLKIKRCVLSIIGGIQPSAIAGLIRGAVSGDKSDGLIQRFQLAVWPDVDKSYTYIDRLPCKQAEHEYNAVFMDLHSLEKTPEPLRMTQEASELFAEWIISINFEARSGRLQKAFVFHIIKSQEAILSIALLLELSEHPNATEVGIDSIKKALVWAKYLRSHARRVYHYESDSHVMLAKHLLSRKNDLGASFNEREIKRKNWSVVNSSSLAGALQLLVDLNYLIVVKVGEGGRPSVRYFWA